ncbi:hypothetical protein GBA52_025819 [Prunus armeniaca]|nr:hypothetical protein GBA52_025819 [Prunus armeniaca]
MNAIRNKKPLWSYAAGPGLASSTAWRQNHCKTLVHTSLSSIRLTLASHNVPSRPYISTEAADFADEAHSIDSTLEPPEYPTLDSVEQLLTQKNDVARLMKNGAPPWVRTPTRRSVVPIPRQERFRNAVKNRSYSVCLVVEGLGRFRQRLCRVSVPRVSVVLVLLCDSSKRVQRHVRYRDNRHVSMGAEKWLDIELWNSTPECFEVLKSCGYRIATTHVGMDAVIVYFLLL